MGEDTGATPLLWGRVALELLAGAVPLLAEIDPDEWRAPVATGAVPYADPVMGTPEPLDPETIPDGRYPPEADIDGNMPPVAEVVAKA